MYSSVVQPRHEAEPVLTDYSCSVLCVYMRIWYDYETLSTVFVSVNPIRSMSSNIYIVYSIYSRSVTPSRIVAIVRSMTRSVLGVSTEHSYITWDDSQL